LKEAEDAEKKAKEAKDAEKKAKDKSEALKGKPPKVRVTPEVLAGFFRNSEEARAHRVSAY
jgi:hypothetical protein